MLLPLILIKETLRTGIRMKYNISRPCLSPDNINSRSKSSGKKGHIKDFFFD
jgi:hypothetical protein